MVINPMDMLEVEIGEGVQYDNLEVIDDDGAPGFGDKETAPTFGNDDEGKGDPRETSPLEDGDESMNTLDMTDTTPEDNGGLNTPEPLDEYEVT
eukprot:GFUD01120055.1.p1 GENE.GFUD01120055.1~~GFUD01120055.1.p1  ORF type:complete len:104 (+),score=45.69 GFUD01120055.1:32-313(+)